MCTRSTHSRLLPLDTIAGWVGCGADSSFASQLSNMSKFQQKTTGRHQHAGVIRICRQRNTKNNLYLQASSQLLVSALLCIPVPSDPGSQLPSAWHCKEQWWDQASELRQSAVTKNSAHTPQRGPRAAFPRGQSRMKILRISSKRIGTRAW